MKRINIVYISIRLLLLINLFILLNLIKIRIFFKKSYY